jgi:transcriptional regulator GlxA family with amidase domain
VTSLCSLGLTPQCSIHDVKRTDIIILPASGWDVMDRIAQNTSLLPWLRKWHSRGAYIAGVCTGVAFLAQSGLLDGRQATNGRHINQSISSCTSFLTRGILHDSIRHEAR